MKNIVLQAVQLGTPEESKWNLPALSWRGGAVTTALTALTLVVALWPGAGEVLQFDRAAIASGELWRNFTGHFTHWSNEHLAWDLLVFFGLGCLCEQLNRMQFVAVLAAAAILIPLGLWLWASDFQTYRGLSGLDTALFAMLAAITLRSAFGERNWVLASMIGMLLVCLVGKTLFELVSGGTMFVQAADFRPVPLAHVIGAAVGLFLGVAASD